MEPIVFMGGIILFAGMIWSLEDFSRETGIMEIIRSHAKRAWRNRCNSRSSGIISKRQRLWNFSLLFDQ